jgi:hypothetical protein
MGSWRQKIESQLKSSTSPWSTPTCNSSIYIYSLDGQALCRAQTCRDRQDIVRTLIGPWLCKQKGKKRECLPQAILNNLPCKVLTAPAYERWPQDINTLACWSPDIVVGTILRCWGNENQLDAIKSKTVPFNFYEKLLYQWRTNNRG